MATVVDALTESIGTFATSAMGAIGAIIPAVLPIMGAIVVVGIGIKVFRKFAR